MKKWVYLFEEVTEAEKYAGDWEGARALLGGKGANLGEMTRIGIPVPPGFTVTTEACNAYLENNNQFPEEMWDQELEAVKAVEKSTGKKFGNKENPLLVSCRSGAKFSMPGMMDTVLNLGLNDNVADGMVRLTNDERFVYDAYRRLVQMFGSVVLGISDEAFEEPLDGYKEEKGYKLDTEMTAGDWKALTETYKGVIKEKKSFDFPQDPYEQLKLATEAVFSFWNGKRAIDYRNAAGIAHDLGVGVNIVTMVFGNMGENSGVGVAFTRNPVTGEKALYGEYLTNAQGEDVVAGIRNTKNIAEMANELPQAYEDFLKIRDILEEHFKEMQDVEFTIEHSKLWMLQTRDGKRTAYATLRIAIDMLDEGIISEREVIKRTTPDRLLPLFTPRIPNNINSKPISQGVNASPGAAFGIAVFDSGSAEELSKVGESVILILPYITPDDVHGVLASKGVITSEGGATSHAAVVCRRFNIPSVVGASNLLIDLETESLMTRSGTTVRKGDLLTIDGTSGKLYLGKVPLIYPKIEEDPYLLRYASIIWDKKAEDFIDQNIGTLWLLRDILNNGTLPRGFSSPIAYKSLDEILNTQNNIYISFTQPSQIIIEDILQEFHWSSNQDSQYMILGILYNLLKLIQDEIGIGNHYLAFRPLTDPISTIVYDGILPFELPIKTIKVNLDYIPMSPFQLIGTEFFGLNRVVQNYLDWASIQLWFAVSVDRLDQPFWCLDRTNLNGESINPGSVNIIGYVVLLNNHILSVEETKDFYNDLRHREHNWSWYDENNTSWREILQAVNALQDNQHISNDILAMCQSLGLVDNNQNITNVGFSLITEHFAIDRKLTTFAGRNII